MSTAHDCGPGFLGTHRSTPDYNAFVICVRRFWGKLAPAGGYLAGRCGAALRFQWLARGRAARMCCDKLEKIRNMLGWDNLENKGAAE